MMSESKETMGAKEMSESKEMMSESSGTMQLKEMRISNHLGGDSDRQVPNRWIQLIAGIIAMMA
jgi:hypothetical protein